MLASAVQKIVRREALTRPEQQALQRHERDKEERLRWSYYASIPKKHWIQMSGRQNKVINEQAERYDLPFGGPMVNLPAFIRRLHDFLAENAIKLAQDEDALMAGAGSPALERYREERALIARFERLQMERELIPREESRLALGRMAAILRGAGETLQREFGPAAGEILREALDDVDREITRAYSKTNGAIESAGVGKNGAASDNEHPASAR